MKKIDYYKRVIEMIDKLYNDHQGFSNWYDSLDDDQENKINDDLIEIVERRINKNKIGDGREIN